MATLEFKGTETWIAFKALTTYDRSSKITLGTKYDGLFTANVRHTDFVSSTTRWNDTEWEAIKVLVRQSFVDDETRRVALLNKADYKEELKLLDSADAKAFKKFRDATHTKVGSKMRDFAAALLSRDTPAEQAKVAKELATVKKARDTKKAKTAKAESGKTGKEKIIAQLATIQLIMQGDEDAEYDVLKLQTAFKTALDILN